MMSDGYERKYIGYDSPRDPNRFDVILCDIGISLNNVMWCDVPWCGVVWCGVILYDMM